MDINKFCYEHITGKSYDEYINHRKEQELALEAPEKLYFLFNHPYTADDTKLNKRRYEVEVDYTRTDAFIEKACSTLKELGLENDIIEQFKNKIKLKGE